MDTRALTRIALSLISAAGLAGLDTRTVQAQALRCEDAAGKVTYTQVACPQGTQAVRTIDAQGKPSSADRATALERARKDAKEAQRIDTAREQEAARQAKAAKANAAPTESRACRKLALRVRQADDDLRAAPLNHKQVAERKLKKAQEDYSAECGPQP